MALFSHLLRCLHTIYWAVAALFILLRTCKFFSFVLELFFISFFSWSLWVDILCCVEWKVKSSLCVQCSFHAYHSSSSNGSYIILKGHEDYRWLLFIAFHTSLFLSLCVCVCVHVSLMLLFLFVHPACVRGISIISDKNLLHILLHFL